ncbi:MAG: glycosyltransferase [Phycisphaerae bacterium]|nr:glycosyltransferase [Phycisphaerae bacterium]
MSRRREYDSVVCFAGQDWWYHNRAHSDVQIMRNLSEHIKVLFVNSIGMRMPTPGKSPNFLRKIARKLTSISKGLVSVSGSMWVFSPIMLPPSRNNNIRRLNADLIAWQIRRALKSIGAKNWFYWVTVPTASDILEKLPQEFTIFNRSDVFSKFPEAREEYIRSHERKMLDRSDIIFYVNEKLMAEDPAEESKKFMLSHGVDFELFSRSEIHPELKNIRHPIVGYFGQIDDYTIDTELLFNAAKELNDMSFVLVGPTSINMSKIKALPNVRYFGLRPYDQIPAFGAGFDVCIMPWKQNEWILRCNPIKLKEYLAIGSPIVTTPFPQTSDYPGLLSVARDIGDFINRIREAVSEDDSLRELRQRAVQNDSWRSKSQFVFELVQTRGVMQCAE